MIYMILDLDSFGAAFERFGFNFCLKITLANNFYLNSILHACNWPKNHLFLSRIKNQKSLTFSFFVVRIVGVCKHILIEK